MLEGGSGMSEAGLSSASPNQHRDETQAESRPVKDSTDEWIHQPIRTNANRIALVVTSLLFFVEWFLMSAIAPFFPLVAHDRGVSKFVIGIIIGACPAAAAMTCPLVPTLVSLHLSLTGKEGRIGVILIGLVAGASAQIGFGMAHRLSHPVGLWIAMRAVAGAAASLVEIPILAVLMKTSVDINADNIVRQGFVGIGQMGGAGIGGLLYSKLGFEATFFVFAGFQLAMLVVMLVVQPLIQDCGDNCLLDNSADDNAASADGCSFESSGSSVPDEAPQRHNNQEVIANEEKISVTRLVWSVREVQITFIFTICGGVSQTILDSFVALQVRAAFGLDPKEIGIVLLTISGIYLSSTLFGAFFVRKYGAGNLLHMGVVMLSMAQLTWGPPPFVDAPADTTFAWVCLSASVVMFGIGYAAVFLPALHYMESSCHKKRDWIARHSSNTSSHLKDDVDDIVSSIYGLAFNLGCSIGPAIGGSIMMVVPKTYVPGCRPGYAPEGCSNGYAWTTFILAITFLLVFVLVIAMPGDSIDKTSRQSSISNTQHSELQEGTVEGCQACGNSTPLLGYDEYETDCTAQLS